MLILVTYDVSTETKEGKKRLLNVAKTCIKHGQRVQNSVFECNLDYSNYLKLKNRLTELIDISSVSLRFYNLGNNYAGKVEHVGTKQSVNLEGTIII